MKILNLYAGLGGNRKLWSSDHKITAVENNPEIAEVYKSFYPDDEVIVADAHQYLLKHYKEFGFIWSSPPCQSHSVMKRVSIHRGQVKAEYFDQKLWQEIVLLQHFSKGHWIVENVKPYYKTLLEPSQKIGRHLMWSNFIIHRMEHKNVLNFIDAKYEDLVQWLGIDPGHKIYYENNHCPQQVLRNCVHPDIGKHILDCAMGAEIKTEELELF